MIKSLKDLLDKFSRFTNSLVYDGGICKRLYSNNNFYDAFLNRDMMYAYEDGSVSEAINMKNKEKEMNKFDKNEKKANYSNQEANSILISQKVK
ncbi:MAG: hypothetical protein PHY49_07585 [Aliarcobacter skirrowii]|nr:hypothetical protein [Aliarcobacter skirrowii]